MFKLDRRSALLALASLAVMFVASAGRPAHAAEIRCACAEAMRPILADLGPKFEQATGHKLVIAYGLAPVVTRRVEGGESFDVAIINPPQVDALITAGKIERDTRSSLGRAGVGVGVPAGSAKPDMSSVDAFKRTLLNSKSVAFPDEGTSGAYFRDVIRRLDLVDPMRDKVRPTAAGVGFAMVARGEAEMIVTIIPQLLAATGLDFAGPVPAELQTWIGMVAGLGTGAHDAAAAKAFIAFLTTPAATAVMKAKGWEPIP